MKKMIIFEPGMCCATGVCGPSVNPELLRVSTILNNLNSKGVLVERYNLTSNPQIFVDNKTINELLMKKGVDVLPAIMVDGEIVKMGSYPTNDEFCALLGISMDLLKAEVKKSNSCCCKNGCC